LPIISLKPSEGPREGPDAVVRGVIVVPRLLKAVAALCGSPAEGSDSLAVWAGARFGLGVIQQQPRGLTSTCHPSGGISVSVLDSTVF